MQNDALAQVYARSIFEMAKDAGGREKLEEINDELQQLVELTRTIPVFGKFLGSPIIDKKRRGDVIRSLLNGRITDLTLRFLLVLNDKQRLNRLEAIADTCDHMLQEEFGRVEVDVFTAGPMGEEARSAIRSRIQSALGKEPVMYTYTDSSMIGGVKLRIGDQLIDGSVQTQLRRMKGNLLRSSSCLRERLSKVIEDNSSQ